jgi:hypothetical protein
MVGWAGGPELLPEVSSAGQLPLLPPTPPEYQLVALSWRGERPLTTFPPEPWANGRIQRSGSGKLLHTIEVHWPLRRLLGPTQPNPLLAALHTRLLSACQGACCSIGLLPSPVMSLLPFPIPMPSWLHVQVEAPCDPAQVRRLRARASPAGRSPRTLHNSVRKVGAERRHDQAHPSARLHTHCPRSLPHRTRPCCPASPIPRGGPPTARSTGW